MKYFKLKYQNGGFEIVKGMDMLDVIKRYDLGSAKHINTRIIELSGEQEAIAINNEEVRICLTNKHVPG